MDQKRRVKCVFLGTESVDQIAKQQTGPNVLYECGHTDKIERVSSTHQYVTVVNFVFNLCMEVEAFKDVSYCQ